MGVERCLRYAFEYARRRNKGKKVTLCGKLMYLLMFLICGRVFSMKLAPGTTLILPVITPMLMLQSCGW